MRFVQQRGIGDCGIAALATLIEQTYEDVYTAMAALDLPARGKSGTTYKRLITLGKTLGITFRLRRKFDVEEAEGLLSVEWVVTQNAHRQHLVVLTHGLIIDPADGEILEADEYLVRNNGRAVSMLEVVK